MGWGGVELNNILFLIMWGLLARLLVIECSQLCSEHVGLCTFLLFIDPYGVLR